MGSGLDTAVGNNFDFNTTVLGAAFSRLVGSDRLFLAFAFGKDFFCRNTLGYQVCLDGVGTTFRQFLVVGVGTDPVGVTDGNDNFGILTGQCVNQFIQFRPCLPV